MNQPDPENRKDLRRNNIKKKKNFDKKDFNIDNRDQHKLNKQFKRQKQMLEDESWEDWENDLS